MRDHVADAAAAAGVTVSRSPDGQYRERDKDPVLDQQGLLNANAKWSHAKARIARILEGSGGSSDVGAALTNAAHPKLAREFMDLFAWYAYYRHRESKWNPFRGLDDGEAARKFVNAVFDICDKSTGKLGGWYTK